VWFIVSKNTKITAFRIFSQCFCFGVKKSKEKRTPLKNSDAGFDLLR
jgi:hypothetical protein